MALTAQQIAQSIARGRSGGSTSSSAVANNLKALGALMAIQAGAKDPLAGSKNALDSRIAAILQSDAPDSYKQTALGQTSSKKQSESWWEKTLNILGKPQSATLALIRRVADPKSNVLKDIQNNIRTSDVLENQDWFKGLPGIAKFGIGLAGDIATDPLTYLTAGTASTAVGGARGASKLAYAAANAAEIAGNADKALDLATLGQKASKGLSMLNKAEKAQIEDLARAAGKIEQGQRLGGVYFNLPGTGRILNKGGVPIEFRIPGSEVLGAIPKSVRVGEEALRKSALGQKVGKAVGGNETKRALINTIRRGAPEQSRQAFDALEGWNLAEARSASYLRQMDADRQRLVNTAKKSNVKMDDITMALNGDRTAALRVNTAVNRSTGISNFMDEVRKFDDAVIDEAHRLAGGEFIVKIEDHAPTLPGAGVSGGTPMRGRKNIFDPAGFELRGSKPGDSFEGQILSDANKTSYAEVVGTDAQGRMVTRGIDANEVNAARQQGREVLEIAPDSQGRGWKQQRDAIASELYGSEYKSMYNMNWDEASKAQVGGMARRLKGEIVKNHLRSKNVAKDVYEEVATAAAVSAKQRIPVVKQRLRMLNVNQKLAQSAVDRAPKLIREAQEDLAYVYRDAVENVDAAATAARETGEQYGVFSASLNELISRVNTAESKVRSAGDARKVLDELGGALDDSSPVYSYMRDIFQRSVDDAVRQTDDAESAFELLSRVRQNMADEYESLNTALVRNQEDARRIEELVGRKAEITGAVREDDLRSGLPGVTKRTEATDATGVVAGERRELPLGGKDTRVSLSPTENVVASFDEAVSVATTGTRAEIREVFSELNRTLRAAGLPTVGLRGSADQMVDAAQKILDDADLLPKVTERPLASVNRKAARAELKRIDDELAEIAGRSPEKTYDELVAMRDEAKALYDEFDIRANNAGVKAEDARRLQDENTKRLAQLDADEMDYRTNLEIERREKATVLRDEADRLAQKELEHQRLLVRFADDDAMVAEQKAAIAVDRAQAAVARAEATAAQAEADLLKMGRTQQRLEAQLGHLATKENETRLLDVMQEGYAKLDMRTQAPEHIAEAMAIMVKMSEPGEMARVLKYFDQATNLFKTWAILTPGFHVRNFIGGVFNNYLAGMSFSSYKGFIRADKIFLDALEKGSTREEAIRLIAARLGGKQAKAYEIVESSGAFRTPGQIGTASAEVRVGIANKRGLSGVMDTIKAKGARTNSLDALTDNPLSRLNYKASERVERTLRGSLAYDVALKGGDEFDVLDNVYKFHFNYDDLSSIEQKYMKRISPFYTWSRKNVPLQVEMLFQKPSAYARIGYLQDNIEKFSAEQNLVPYWFGETGAIRIPFTNPTGEQLYAMPDLPPLDLKKAISPKEWLGEINPVLKVPFELQFNKQLYNQQQFREGYVPFPKAWEKMGIGWVTDLVGITKQDKDGNRVARDSSLYALESYLPFLGRTRRMFPSEDRYSRRVVASWASMVFGITIRANTEADQQSELFRRSKKLESMNTNLTSLGYGGFKTMTKDVATKSKPGEGEKSPYLMVVEPRGGLRIGSPYQMPTKGLTGGQQLDRALASASRTGVSPELQSLIARVQAGRKK